MVSVKRNTGSILLSPEAQRRDLLKVAKPRFDTAWVFTATRLPSGDLLSQGESAQVKDTEAGTTGRA